MRLLGIVLIMIISPLAHSQVGDFSEPVPMTKMVMKQWTGEDGLISNNLTSVTQTNDGFIWITSFNGLHRFDGINFKLLDKENVSFLRTNSFQSITCDNQSIIASTEGSGVVRYLDGQLMPMSEFPVSSVYKMTVDSKGRYWCGTNNEGLFVMEEGEVRRIEFDAFDQVLILDIYEDSRGRIWIATEGNGLILFENDTFRRFEIGGLADQNVITAVLESKFGELMVGTVNGLYAIADDGAMASLVTGLEGIYVNDLVEDRAGMLWVATERGLFRVFLKAQFVEVFDEMNGLPANQVSSVMIDHEGSIWLTTKKAGLVRMNLGSALSLGVNDGITSTRINAIVEHAGKVYIGSDDGSIFVKNGNEVRKIILSTKDEQVGVRDFFFDQGAMWVASYRGLHQYENGREKLLTMEDGLSSNLIRRIFPASDGSIWLASRSGGAMQMLGNQVINVYDTDNGLMSDFVLAINEDREGNIVIGTHSGGISVISRDTILTYQSDFKGLVNFNIHVDEENRYWISSSVGVFLFSKGTFRQLVFDTSFKTEAIFDFVPDNAGNIWLTTNLGVIRIYQDQLDDFVNGSRSSVEGKLFDSNDGMLSKECTGATRSLLRDDGAVWFPTLNGIAIIDPKQIVTNEHVPKVSITSFAVDDMMVLKDQSRIEPGKLRYQFEFSAASFLASDRVRFMYSLSGVDEGWILTSENTIEYTNLPPNTYTFSVLGSNNDGVWNEIGDKRTFVVTPFYYQTLWFKVITGVLVLLFFYFIFVWRVRRVHSMNRELSKVNQELDRFVYSASHDIRAPLTSILGAASIAKERPDANEKNEYLGMIETSAKKLDGFIRDIIDYSRNQRLELVVEEVDMEEELNSILDSFKYLDQAEHVERRLDTQVTKFATDVRRLRVVLKNIISNAFFYHDPSKDKPFISIGCKLVGSNLELTISDNGLGMKPEILENIFNMFYRGNTDSKGSGLGLYIAKENIEKLNGTINVTSELKVGTTFTISLPRTTNTTSGA